MPYVVMTHVARKRARKRAYLLEAHFIHDALGGHDVFVCGPNKLHSQRYGAVGGIKVEEPRLCDAQEGCHILVVGQRGRQTHNANHALASFHLIALQR